MENFWWYNIDVLKKRRKLFELPLLKNSNLMYEEKHRFDHPVLFLFDE